MKSSNNRKKIIIAISWLVVIAWAAVIFYLSSQTAAVSTVQSRRIIHSVSGIMGKKITDEAKLTNIDGVVRESAHGFEFCVLGFLLFNALYISICYRDKELLEIKKRGLDCKNKYRYVNCILCALLVCTVYALSDEIHQIPIPGRAFELMDLLIDFTGSFIGIIISLIVHTIMEKKRNNNE